MLIKEDLQKTYSENYGHLPEEQIDRMVNNQIESLYGSHEEYEQKLEKHKESQAEEFKPEFDAAAYKELQNELDEEDAQIKDIDALAFYLRQKAFMGEAKARTATLLEFGDAAFNEPENDPLDKEVDRLIDKGIEVTTSERRLIKGIMRTQEVSVTEAMKQVSLDKQKREHKLEQDIKKAGGREVEYYQTLSFNDKQALETLKAVQPEANWTARKFYKMFNDKPLPRKPAAPKEETVPYEQYEAERNKTKELIKKLAEFN